MQSPDEIDVAAPEEACTACEASHASNCFRCGRKLCFDHSPPPDRRCHACELDYDQRVGPKLAWRTREGVQLAQRFGFAYLGFVMVMMAGKAVEGLLPTKTWGLGAFIGIGVTVGAVALGWHLGGRVVFVFGQQRMRFMREQFGSLPRAQVVDHGDDR